MDFLGHDEAEEQIEAAKEETSASPKYVKGVLAAVINEGDPVDYETITERLGVSTTTDVSKTASELEHWKILSKDRRDDGMWVDLNTDGIEEIRQAVAEGERTEELVEEF